MTIDNDVLREINHYFEVNNENINSLKSSLAIMQQIQSDLATVLYDMKKRLELLERQTLVKKSVN